jgi:para-aminobenzoate synthetase component I
VDFPPSPVDRMINLPDFVERMNRWGEARIPFLFIIDFEMKRPIILPLDGIRADEILFDIQGFTNAPPAVVSGAGVKLKRKPVSFKDYKLKFDQVYGHLSYGDSFLTNLTIKTEVEPDRSLRALFDDSRARYKLWYKEEFLVFSPEIFVQIRDGRIFSYPMKGTIDAAIAGAEQKILLDRKELAEHVTMVDLIRNDLSQVATDVQVARFRYVEELRTQHKNLLQVSSEIVGTLPDGYYNRLGDILVQLLPAGSVSGAPKTKTLAVIRESENEDRGYYTGVFGYFNGEKLDSGVMIRFIEKRDGQCFYRSGGGITNQSVAENEYQEAIDKVYVPVD